MTRNQSLACLRVRTGPHGSTRKHVYRRQTPSPYNDADCSSRDTTELEGWISRSKHQTKQQHQPHQYLHLHHHQSIHQQQQQQHTPQFLRGDHQHDYDAHDMDSRAAWDVTISFGAGAGDALGLFDSGSVASPSCSTPTSATMAKAQSLGYIPLPPAVCRMNLAGSPLSPFGREIDYHHFDPYENQGRHRGAASIVEGPWDRRSGLRTMSSGGGSPGGGGSGGAGGDEPMTPGGGDVPDGTVPSSYTFRRRNAVVEGTEDAPKPEDFPPSPK